MYSKLPALPGETPTKVVFEGLEHVDPAVLNDLYVANLGTIAAFQIKARAARVVSDQPGSSMQQALPDGRRLRYEYNQGQETIYVKLTSGPHPRRKNEPCDILLAIDVLFDPAQFVVGDIYSKVPYTVTTPGAPLYPDNPDYYDFTGAVEYDYTLLYAYDPVDSGGYGNWAQSHPDPNNPGHNFDGYFHDGTFQESGGSSVAKYTPSLSDGPFGSVGDATAAAISAHNNTSHGNMGWNRIEFTSYGGITSNNLGGYAQFTAYYQVTKWQVGGVYNGPTGPPTTTTEYHNYRERRTYLDILPVVGLRIASTDPDKPDKLALSVGDHAGETDDLRAVVPGDTTASIERSIAFAAPADGDHFYGASFTAKVTLRPGESLSDVKIEVYIGSSNVTKQNSQPGLVGSTFDADDSSMRYDVTDTLKWDVQVREFLGTSEPPLVVQVATTAEGKIEEFGPDDLTTVTATTMDQKARELDWMFAAGAKWADGGNEPADPTAKDDQGNPTMGKLLVQSDGDIEQGVAKTTAFNREVLTEPKWNGAVTDMTLATTITWTPPSACEVNGKAKLSTTSDPGDGGDPSPGPGDGGGPGLGLPPIV